MEYFSNPDDKKLELSQLAINHIKASAKWGKFIAIIGFVFVAFLVLIALVMAIFLPGINLDELQEMQGMQSNPGTEFLTNGFGPFLGVLYIVIAILYFIPVLFLYKYSEKSMRAIKSVDSDLLTAAFNNMRRQYKYVGIMTIISIALYALIFIGSFIAGIFSAII